MHWFLRVVELELAGTNCFQTGFKTPIVKSTIIWYFWMLKVEKKRFFHTSNLRVGRIATVPAHMKSYGFILEHPQAYPHPPGTL